MSDQQQSNDKQIKDIRDMRDILLKERKIVSGQLKDINDRITALNNVLSECYIKKFGLTRYMKIPDYPSKPDYMREDCYLDGMYRVGESQYQVVITDIIDGFTPFEFCEENFASADIDNYGRRNEISLDELLSVINPNEVQDK